MAIGVGDKVKIVYNKSFKWGNKLIREVDKIEAFVVYIPCDTGDCWIFKTIDGIEFAQNPSSSNLDKIILISKAEVIKKEVPF